MSGESGDKNLVRAVESINANTRNIPGVQYPELFPGSVGTLANLQEKYPNADVVKDELIALYRRQFQLSFENLDEPGQREKDVVGARIVGIVSTLSWLGLGSINAAAKDVVFGKRA